MNARERRLAARAAEREKAKAARPATKPDAVGDTPEDREAQKHAYTAALERDRAARERARKAAAEAKDGGSEEGGGGGGGFMAMRGELLQNREALAGAETSHDDFKSAFKKISRSGGKDQLARYREWMSEFGSA